MATPPSPEMAQHSSFSPAKINCDGDEEHQRLPTHNLHNCDGGGHQEWSTHAGHTSTISHLFLRPSPPAQTHSFHQDGHTSHAYSSHHLVDSSFNDAGSATDEMHLDRHGTPASAIVESTAGTKNSPPPAAGRMFACPFYLHKPRQHTKCADKSFPYLSRVRFVFPFRCRLGHRPRIDKHVFSSPSTENTSRRIRTRTNVNAASVISRGSSS